MALFTKNQFLLFLLTCSLVLLGVINKPDFFTPTQQQLLSKPVTFTLANLVGFVVALLWLTFLISFYLISLRARLAKQKESELETAIQKSQTQLLASENQREQMLQVKDQQIAVLNQQLRDRDRLRLIDIVTGIPNQAKWELDVDQMTVTNDPDPRNQMIIIDIDNFRLVNQKYGYEKGDEVIREFSRFIYNTMRRNEEIYKNFMRNEEDAPVEIEERWQRIYRKYTGGDEFIFIVNGTQVEALGFLVRLARDLMPLINDRISKFILPETYKLTFHAGMCEWILGDRPQDILQRLHGCLRKANHSKTSSLYLYPPKTAEEYEQETLASTGSKPKWNPYREANLIFAKADQHAQPS